MKLVEGINGLITYNLAFINLSWYLTVLFLHDCYI